MANNKQLLVKSAIVLALAASPMAADAANITVNGTADPTTIQTLTANGDTFAVVGSGNLAVAGDKAVTTDGSATEVVISVAPTSASNGVSNTGDFSTIDLSGAAGVTIGSITNSGTITGASTSAGKATLLVGGGADSFTITNNSGSFIRNTDAATGGEAVAITGADGNQAATISNAGTISTANTAGIAINLTDADGGSTLAITNTGTITAGAGGTAINVATGGNNLTLTQNTGTITGNIAVAGAGTFTGTANSGNAGTITGNITTASGALTFTQQTGGSVSGNITTTSGDADITLNGSSSVGGNVTLGNNASSTLVLNNTSNVAGNVVLNQAGQQVTINNTASITGTINGAGIVNVNKNLTLNTGNLIGGGTAITKLAIGTGTTTSFGTATTIGANTVEVGGTGTFSLGNTARTITATSGIDMTSGAAGNGTLALGTASHVLAGGGGFTAGAGDIITSTISSTGSDGATLTMGKITGVGAISNNSGTVAQITLNSDAGYLAAGSYALVDGSSGATALSSSSISVNGGTNTTGLLTFTSTNTGNNINIVVARAATASVATNANADSVGAALDSIGATGGTNLDLIQSALQNSTTAAGVTTIADSTTAQTDNSLTQGTFDIVQQGVGVVDNRLSSLRSGTSTASNASGMSAGYIPAGTGAWIQGFGSTSDQETVKGIAGYEADTYGVAIGADKKVRGDVRVGVSVAYANSQLDSKSNAKTTDADTYQINLYGSKEFGKFYTDGLVGFSYNQYDSSRKVASIPATAKGSFDGQTYLAKVGGGYTYKVPNTGLEIVPNASVTYAYNTVQGYTERGADALNLKVESENSSLLQGKIGANAGYNFTAKGLKVRPEIRAAYLYDVIGDNQINTAQFNGTGVKFKTEGAEIEKSSYTVGAGLDIASKGGYTVSADYDYQGKSDYSSHSGILRVRYDF